MIYAILSLGLNVQWGFTGLVNLGHVGFFAAVREILVGLFLILLMIYRQEEVLPEEKIEHRN